jgi:hypothetical protein
VKVKSHSGEPINERADTLAEEGRALSDKEKRWDDRTDRMTFEVRKGDTTVNSVWTNSVRNASRKQAGWAKLQEARTTAAKYWTERVWYRHNQRWLQASKHAIVKTLIPKSKVQKSLKSKVGLAAAKAAALRINLRLNVEGCGTVWGGCFFSSFWNRILAEEDR